MNLSLAAEKPTLMERDFSFTDADNPFVAYGRFKGGEAVFVNLAPGKDNSYLLIVSHIDMLEVKSEDRMKESIHGWFRPKVPFTEFFSGYNRQGGAHHGAIVYGDAMNKMKVLKEVSELMDWKLVRI